MKRGMMLALLLVTAAIGPASAQRAQDGGLSTETQDRMLAGDSGEDLLWNLLGLVGLLGLLGLQREHEEDSYHPASFE
jgi:hypothetical protein